jgi:hypothetical protein
MPDERSVSRVRGRSGLRPFVAVSGKGLFLAQNWEGKAFGLLLILSDNYNLTTNKFTTETQSARRTHRDFLAERYVASCSL